VTKVSATAVDARHARSPAAMHCLIKFADEDAMRRSEVARAPAQSCSAGLGNGGQPPEVASAGNMAAAVTGQAFLRLPRPKTL